MLKYNIYILSLKLNQYVYLFVFHCYDTKHRLHTKQSFLSNKEEKKGKKKLASLKRLIFINAT